MDLSLPHEMIEISALLPKVQAALEGIDQNLAAEYLMDAAIKFAKDSRTLQTNICIGVLSCVTSYNLDVAPYRIAEVRGVGLETKNCTGPQDVRGLVYVEGTTLYLDEEYRWDDGATILVNLVLTLKRSSDLIPEDLYEEWEPAIVHGALAKLYLMSGATWGNKGLADRHEVLYSDEVKRARFANTTRHRPVAMRLSPKWRDR